MDLHLPMQSLLTVTGAVVVMIVWWLDLQLPMQSVPITTNVMSSNPPEVSSTNKTDHYDITEILVKVALNTITLTLLPLSPMLDHGKVHFIKFVSDVLQSGGVL